MVFYMVKCLVIMFVVHKKAMTALVFEPSIHIH
jgi:hypothetical protein